MSAAGRTDDLSLAECQAYDSRPGRSGGWLRFRCPRHGGDHQRSLSVNTETGRFSCHACGIWGTVTGHQGAGYRDKPVTAAATVKAMHPMHRNQAAYERARISVGRFRGSAAEEYARRRGVSDVWAAAVRLGYWKGGWSGVDSEWLTFPLRCPLTGRVVGVYGRNIHSDDGAVKGRVLGPKGLFGAEGAGPVPDDVLITEGPFDALALLATPGLAPARALIGASAQAAWFDACRRVCLLLDDDGPGARATERLVDELQERRYRRGGAGPAVFALAPGLLQERFGVKDLGELLRQGIPVPVKLPPINTAEPPGRRLPCDRDGETGPVGAGVDVLEQLPEAAAAPGCPRWAPETAGLVGWFLDRLSARALPEELRLPTGGRILNPPGWYARLQQWVEQGPAGYMACNGALRDNLVRLRDLVEGAGG